MKSIKNIYLYSLQDTDKSLTKEMLKFNPSNFQVDLNKLEDPLHTISKRFNFTMKNKVLNDLYTEGRLILSYNTVNYNLPIWIPSYLYNLNNKIVSIINISPYATENKKTGELTIDPRKLFSLLQVGSILLTCYDKWNRITMNQNVVKQSMMIYSMIMTKVIDKLYAVNLSDLKSDKVKYIFAKFFLINIMEKSNTKLVDDLAFTICKTTPRATIDDFSSMIGVESYENINTLILAIANTIDGANELTLRTYVDNFSRMYGTSCMYAMEYYPAFLHMIFSVVVGSHLNNEFMIEGLVGPLAISLYNDFANIMND